MVSEHVESAMKRQYPIIITVRDRLTDLLSLLEWLGNIGQREVWLCDNASTYEPMVKFLANTPTMWCTTSETWDTAHRG